MIPIPQFFGYLGRTGQLPNYDAWRTESPPEPEDDDVCPGCGQRCGGSMGCKCDAGDDD